MRSGAAMLTRSVPAWQLPERSATPEKIYLRRRELLAGMAAGPILLAAARAEAATEGDAPIAPELSPAKRNEAVKLDRAVTPEPMVTTYNNYYEFGSYKQISKEAQALKLRPWQVAIGGMVEKPLTLEAEDLIRKMP